MADSFVQDPDEELDYVRDWSALLGADTIASSTWTPEAGITVNSDSFDDTTATVWISGGTLGSDYAVVNEITTAGGRTHNKTLRFRIRAK